MYKRGDEPDMTSTNKGLAFRRQ